MNLLAQKISFYQHLYLVTLPRQRYKTFLSEEKAKIVLLEEMKKSLPGSVLDLDNQKQSHSDYGDAIESCVVHPMVQSLCEEGDMIYEEESTLHKILTRHQESQEGKEILKVLSDCGDPETCFDSIYYYAQALMCLEANLPSQRENWKNIMSELKKI